MKKNHLLFTLSCLVLSIYSCKKENQLQAPQTTSISVQEMIAENGVNPDEAIFSVDRYMPSRGYVYTESNSKTGNQIFLYDKSEDGSLHFRKKINSGGNGTGEGLGSQGALAISEDHKWLFAVNAGSNSFSVFRIGADGDLSLVVSVSSLGILPVSITTNKRFVYVLNNASSTICGFHYDENGVLTKTGDSPHKLSADNADPAEVKFSSTGDILYVTEKATNKIDAFSLAANGNITSTIFNQSQGVQPFGFSIGRNNFLIVSNAANGFSGAGSCTSYSDDGNGNLTSVNGAISNFQSAPCWVATGKFGVFAFISNTGTNNISTYYLNQDGKLMLVNSYAAAAGEAPIDIIVSSDNYYVYNINSGSHTISEYIRTAGGVIKKIGKVENIPEYASGLVTY